MIAIEDLCFSYPDAARPAVERISLTIDDYSWTVITGAMGSGKTTLCKLIKGILKPGAGKIVPTAPQTGFSDLAYLGGDPQETFVGVSVEEDIVFGMENFGLSRSEMKTRLGLSLSWTGLCGMEKRLVHTLSGGEQQKLALAGALAAGARTLILDEALNMLDKPVRKSIRGLIDSLRREPGLTIIEVTHNWEDIFSADKIIFINRGLKSFEGKFPEFSGHPDGRAWMRASWGIGGLKAAMGSFGISLPECRDNSELSECLLKVIKK